jgi:cyclophilin family peptidyl-prolyl cis-trans isomerase
MFAVRCHVVFALAFAFALAGCGKSKTNSTSAAAGPAVESGSAAASGTSSEAAYPTAVDPVVVLHTTEGDITVQLFAEKAPRTVENFLRGYAERGYYNQTIFHHIERGKMLIGGGYTADLERKAPRAPIYNESNNGLSNRRGTLAMIRESDGPHTATSEFFVNLTDNADFDFKAAEPDDVPGYCVFGEVTSGMDVVDRIARLPTKAQGAFPQVPSPQVAITGVQRVR